MQQVSRVRCTFTSFVLLPAFGTSGEVLGSRGLRIFLKAWLRLAPRPGKQSHVELLPEDNDDLKGSCAGAARRASGGIKGVGDQDVRNKDRRKREERKEVREGFPASIIERDQSLRSLRDGVAISSRARFHHGVADSAALTASGNLLQGIWRTIESVNKFRKINPEIEKSIPILAIRSSSIYEAKRALEALYDSRSVDT